MAERSGARCRSETKRTGCTPGPRRSADDLGALDDDVLERHVLMHAAATGLHGLDAIDDILSFGDPAEHAIAPALRRRRGVVEKAVVVDVDEELRRRRVRLWGTGHRDGGAGPR